MTTIFKETGVVSIDEYNEITNTLRCKRTHFEPNQFGDMVYYFDLDMDFEKSEDLVTILNKIEDGWFIVDNDI